MADSLWTRNRRERTERVLNAAEALFLSKGYEQTRMEEIAQSASVAATTVYNYFTTKPNLLANLALRHVREALPERRAYIAALPDDPVEGIIGFERLIAGQVLRHLTRECWRVILSSEYLEPDGNAAKTAARLNRLVLRHYIQLLRSYRDRGRLDRHVDCTALAKLIVGITTSEFGRFVAGNGGDENDLLALGVPHIRLIMHGWVKPARRSRRNTSDYLIDLPNPSPGVNAGR